MPEVGLAQSRFMVDHMLIKLGKYLRIIGCDAAWDTRRRTHELILQANDESRVFLTRNRRLPDQYPVPVRVLTVDTAEPVAQLHQVAAAFDLDVESTLFTRCIRCNLPLSEIADKAEIGDRVHPNVLGRYDRFYTCPRCHTVFWKGSHVRNTCRKLGLADLGK